MKKHEKLFFCVTATILSIIVLLTVLDSLAPRIINLDSTKENIRSIVAEKTGGTIDYYRIVPSIFPVPGVELEKIHLSVPGTVDVTARSVKVYPEIIPLLWGEIVVSKLLVQRPELTLSMDLSSRLETVEEAKAQTSFAYIRKSLEMIMAPLGIRSPDLEIEIREGKLDITTGVGEGLRFRELDTYLISRGSRLEMNVSCRTNFSKNITLTGTLDPITFNVQGKTSLAGFRPDIFLAQIIPSAAGPLAEIESDLSFTFVLFEPKLIIASLGGTAGHSSFSGINAEIDFSREYPFLYITRASLELSLAQVFKMFTSTASLSSHLKGLNSINGTIVVTSTKVEGPLFEPKDWDYLLRGEAYSVTVNETHLPDTFTVLRGELTAVPEKITFMEVHVAMLDTSIQLSGVLSDFMAESGNLDITAKGEMGTETVRWINEIAHVPPSLRVERPLSVSRADLRWSRNSTISLDADITVPEGPSVNLELIRSAGLLSINKLHIQDEQSNTLIALDVSEKEVGLEFDGILTAETASSLLTSSKEGWWIQGSFEAIIPRDKSSGFVTRGELKGGGFAVQRDTGLPLIINAISLSAENNVISINRADLGLGDKKAAVDGNITTSGRDFLLDVHVDTDSVTWDDIALNFLTKHNTPEGESEQARSDSSRILGTVEVRSGSFQYKRFRWTPVRAVVSLGPEEVRVDIPEAVICDISTPGSLTVRGGEVRLDFKGVAKNRKLKNSLNCLLGEKVDLTGEFDFIGHITAQGKAKGLKRSLDGKVKFTAKDGIVYRYPLFSRIFSIVNVLEVFKGRYDDIISKGFPYDSISIKGDIKNGKLMLREAVMDGSTMKIVGEGEVDLTDKDTDITLIVSPLRTIDSIIEQIPIIRDITAGTLISIAMKVSGKVDDPEIIAVPPSSVGEGIVGMVKRVFKLPLKLLESEGIYNK